MKLCGRLEFPNRVCLPSSSGSGLGRCIKQTHHDLLIPSSGKLCLIRSLIYLLKLGLKRQNSKLEHMILMGKKEEDEEWNLYKKSRDFTVFDKSKLFLVVSNNLPFN